MPKLKLGSLQVESFHTHPTPPEGRGTVDARQVVCSTDTYTGPATYCGPTEYWTCTCPASVFLTSCLPLCSVEPRPAQPIDG
jgi:hypothetical protein